MPTVQTSLASALALACCLAFAAGARAADAERTTGQHCLGEPSSQLTVGETVIMMVNPTGPEHHLRLTYCHPLITEPGMLFDFTNWRVGLLNYFGGVYSHFGGFATISPLSILQFSAEVAGILVWPLPIEYAGYYPRESYHSSYKPETVPPGEGGSTQGYNATFGATLQVELPVGPVSVAVIDSAEAEYWSIGPKPYYVNLRRDTILARRDWIVMNTGLVLIGIDLAEDLKLRVGAMDYLAHVPAADFLSHRTSAMGMVAWERPGATIRVVEGFVTLGVHTHHPFRAGELVFLGGVSATYDLRAE